MAGRTHIKQGAGLGEIAMYQILASLAPSTTATSLPRTWLEQLSREAQFSVRGIARKAQDDWPHEYDPA